jgi:two-component system, LuxR family, response regulator FixJ
VAPVHSSPRPIAADDPPTVFVLDDDRSMRESLTFLLESVRLRVEAFGGAREFLDNYDPNRPGCLVLDIRLQGMGGLDLLGQLRDRAITLPVIVVTAFGDVRTAVAAMRAGAIDVMEKPVADQVLLDRVHQAIELDREARAADARRRAAAALFALLSRRERQVLALVTAGKPNKSIAAELGVAAKTVEGYRATLMQKLGVHSVAELVRLDLLVEPGTRPSRAADLPGKPLVPTGKFPH